MVFNLLKIGLLITAAQLLIASGCKKGKTTPCISGTPRYSFTATSEFTPQKEIYNVGDTIFLNSTIPKTLIDQVSNQQIDYSNCIGIGGGFSTSVFDTIQHKLLDGLDKFTIFDILGTTTIVPNISNSGKSFIFTEATNYELKTAIVLKFKGLFQLGINNLSCKGIQNKNCTNASFDMTVTNTQKNFHLFQYALGYPADALHIKNGYCFRVQ